ncbi:MAG: hypothetical protein SGI90_10200 [Candidatus Eisenbacteria bacterium]|nr:hypothetical protein [Candidatus Eisenbacteria bacterium]
MRLSDGYHVVSMIVLLTVGGCAGGPGVNIDTRSTYVTEHPETPATFVPAILGGQIMIGMAESMVLASWGPPTRAERLQNDVRHDLKWVYGNYLASSAVSHLFFKNGRLELFEFIDTKTQQSFQVTSPSERLALQSRPPETKGGSRGSP